MDDNGIVKQFLKYQPKYEIRKTGEKTASIKRKEMKSVIAEVKEKEIYVSNVLFDEF